jgi:hypothetical protein
MVGESPDPMVHQKGEAGGFLDEHNGRGPEHRPPPPTAGEQAHPSTTNQTESTTYPEMTERCADGVGMHEEVLSTPQEPFIGMRFDTLESARAHYNAYAAKVGFSIKANTSKRHRFTDELEKQQFVCNKYRPPKTEEETQKERMIVVEDVSRVQLDDNIVEEEGSGSSKKKSSSRFCVQRKRETIKQTKCQARMFVKLIDNKWEVCYFVAEHNHPLVVKPSLTKYLRSHRGIPRDEKEFLRCLHNCNLEIGMFVIRVKVTYNYVSLSCSLISLSCFSSMFMLILKHA